MVTIGNPPECHFFSQNRVVNSAISYRFRTERLRNNRIKSRKKDGDKIAVVFVKDVRQLGCVMQDTEPPQSSSNLRKGTEVLETIRRVRFTRPTQRQANIKESKGPSLGKVRVKIPHQRKRQERCARGEAWRLAKNIF